MQNLDFEDHRWLLYNRCRNPHNRYGHTCNEEETYLLKKTTKRDTPKLKAVINKLIQDRHN